MKKVVSIFLVVLLLLNVMGYYGLFLGLRYKNTLQVTKRIDADNYSASETVTIKIPLAIPYYGDTDFARVEGEIEYEGQIYRLVKQKLERDTLHVICIQDAKAKHLEEALAEYVKTFADQSADCSNTRTIQSFIKDYAPASFSLDAAADGWAELLHFKTVDSSDSRPYLTFPSPPPKS